MYQNTKRTCRGIVLNSLINLLFCAVLAVVTVWLLKLLNALISQHCQIKECFIGMFLDDVLVHLT